jgi:hypothetical protein
MWLMTTAPVSGNAPRRSLVRLPVSVQFGPSEDGSRRTQVELDDRPARRASRAVAVAVLWIVVVAGTGIAVVAAAFEQRGNEVVGTFGVEFGAALWFGGVVALGARRGATVARALLLVGLALGGAGLIVVAVVLGWSGAGLGLAMEFGVGAMAVPFVDVLLLGVLYRTIDQYGSGSPTGVVRVSLAASWPPVTVSVDRHDGRRSGQSTPRS